ncbi:hypothetical protein EVAR_80166_1 [Eumeta japonica]|uniref:Uncharacterized protein n=1 Tax=Eumeta variegata TaxID=151549 RepID=A0A4C1YBJ7_EUMVA|nr:hypothetical protein EVAR_80166_1 [Eumeta japonica]
MRGSGPEVMRSNRRQSLAAYGITGHRKRLGMCRSRFPFAPLKGLSRLTRTPAGSASRPVRLGDIHKWTSTGGPHCIARAQLNCRKGCPETAFVIELNCKITDSHSTDAPSNRKQHTSYETRPKLNRYRGIKPDDARTSVKFRLRRIQQSESLYVLNIGSINDHYSLRCAV